ncbi:MAG TPA: YaaA family protein, partial [Campylobacterales bacterium]|nr:YaaA family protein [Campylobacterales bacterium]
APSETKVNGGNEKFVLESLLFQDLTATRKRLLHQYINILQRNDLDELSTMFGLKKVEDINYHNRDIVHELTMKAIKRYTGVAFDHLDYDTLNTSEQKYIDDNVILCSNLFGFIRSNDLIPEYRLKQGASVGQLKPEKLYKEQSHLMEVYLANDDILDLRAGFYDKFYKPKKAYTTLKFIKNGKVVSHWAKAYRGIVLREVAKANIETLDDFKKLPIENLSIQEILEKKNKREIVYTIDN